MRSTRLWVVVVGLQLLILASQWGGSATSLPQAQAQVPDAGAQRIAMIDQLKELNAKVDKLVDLLGSGDLQVRVAKDDEKK